jgi:TolA-binding protein
MTSTATAPTHLKLNYNDREYPFEELPRPAQLLLQDMVRLDQQISQLQFELRHLQAARQMHGTTLRKTMQDEEQQADRAERSGADGEGGGDDGDY